MLRWHRALPVVLAFVGIVGGGLRGDSFRLRLQTYVLVHRGHCLAFIGCFATAGVVIVVKAHLYAPHVAANVELLTWSYTQVVLRVPLTIAAWLPISINGNNGVWIGSSWILSCLENHSVHSIDGSSCLALPGEELLAADSARDDVAHEGVPLWQVCCEIHFFPASHQKLVRMVVYASGVVLPVQLTICTSS